MTGDTSRSPSSGDRPPRPDNASDAYTIIAYLLAGLVVWGGAGLLVDRWLDTRFFVLVGMLVGGASAMYIIWIRYGRQ